MELSKLHPSGLGNKLKIGPTAGQTNGGLDDSDSVDITYKDEDHSKK